MRWFEILRWKKSDESQKSRALFHISENIAMSEVRLNKVTRSIPVARNPQN